jgi:hypothetical protein
MHELIRIQGVAKDTVAGKEVQAHIYEWVRLPDQANLRYTSQVVVSDSGEVGFGSVPVQILFCLKEQASVLTRLSRPACCHPLTSHRTRRSSTRTGGSSSRSLSSSEQALLTGTAPSDPSSAQTYAYPSPPSPPTHLAGMHSPRRRDQALRN